MDFFVQNIYTIILIPLWVALLIFIGKFFAVLQYRKLVAALTILGSIYALVFSIGAFTKTLLNKGFTFVLTNHFIAIDNYNFDIGIYLDGVSAWLILLVAIVSLLVNMYAYSYMQYDKSFMRFFGYINFFMFSMYGLILAPNLFQMYLFWELVGVSSYLLIGFWYKKTEVTFAARKTFIINRIGDFAFLSGIILAGYIVLTNLSNFSAITIPFEQIEIISAQIYGCTSDGIFILLCLLLLMGAIAKSAQFPLHTWLIDAMKGPVPVSALIHSATMVVAGVLLLIRLYPLFSLNEYVLQIIAIIGTITAVMCSAFAMCQNDMKKVLAYSTHAQLGLMFLSVAMCSVTVALIHLTAHAIIKAMLFLACGVVIYSLNGNTDIKLAGGLRKKLPTTAISFLIGIFSLSGFFFAGFASKELMFSALLTEKHYVYAVIFLIIAFMTAFYLFRLYFYIFEGEKHYEDELKPVDFNMNLIPAIFSILVILLWFVLPKTENILMTVIMYIVIITGLFTAYVLFTQKNLLKKIPLIQDLFFNGFYLDEFYFNLSRIYNNVARGCYLLDKYVFESISYCFSLTTRLISWTFSKLQTGNIQSYLSYSLFLIMMCFGGIILVYSLIIYFSEVQ